jgi:predicted nucleic acid-binding protein
MIYLDTSVVVPLFIAEPESEAVDAWLDTCNDPLVSSDWLLTEFASALAIKLRKRELSEAKATAVRKEFDRFCSDVCITPVSRAAFREAAQLTRKYQNGLRASDALHLAVAMEIGATSLATLDNRMAENARCLMLSVESI